MLDIQQTIGTKAEELAFDIAVILDECRNDPNPFAKAQTQLKIKAKEYNLVYGEVQAIAHIASCMLHGRRWKK